MFESGLDRRRILLHSTFPGDVGGGRLLAPPPVDDLDDRTSEATAPPLRGFGAGEVPNLVHVVWDHRSQRARRADILAVPEYDRVGMKLPAPRWHAADE